MKKLLFSLSLLFPSGIFAQSTAMDFTKTDCNTGANHNLYSELDSGYVIILEYVMIPSCQPCIDAYGFMEPVISSYATSHPGRVKLYQVAYNNAYTCTAMNNWASANSMTSTRFIQGASEVSYYGGMGMPTVVVTGTSSHTVFGKFIGFLASDTANFRANIDAALLAISNDVKEISTDSELTIFPSPASDFIQFDFNASNENLENISVLDITGKTVLQLSTDVIESKTINISSLTGGIYFVRLTTTSGKQYFSKFQVVR